MLFQKLAWLVKSAKIHFVCDPGWMSLDFPHSFCEPRGGTQECPWRSDTVVVS